MHRYLLVFCLALASPSLAEEDTWPFQPGTDRFAPDALLDLRGLNEAVAGETGFVRLSPDGNGFVRGDGAPIRFWAVNTDLWRKDGAPLRAHARFLAKRGVNMVRFHGQLPQAGRDGGGIEAINERQRDGLWRLVSAMKAVGIYTTFSPYYPHAVSGQAAARWRSPTDSPGMTGLIYFDPEVQAAYKAWLRDVLVPENPYTGLALKDDPALAIIQMQNEDSLLFWTFNQIKGREARLLGARFGAFLREKYGSLSAAREAWQGAKAPGPLDGMADDWQQGVIALSNIWHLTRAAPRQPVARLNDQAAFLTRLMADWHQEVARFLQEEIGARQLFNPGNWRTADPIGLDDLERFSYLAGDVVGMNRYVTDLHKGQYQGWAIVKGDRVRTKGVLGRPLDLPITLRQPQGRPYMIPETLWVPPIWEQSEGPLLMAAYQALTGIDISYWFSTGEAQWRAPGSANGFLPSIGKWVFATPMQLGMFPAAALIFRQGLVEEAPPVVVETRPLPDLWSRTDPLVVGQEGYDPNRDRQRRRSVAPSAIRPFAFLTGPVQLRFGKGSTWVSPELSNLIDEQRRTVQSATGQLSWDWGKEVVLIDAPRAQGVIGDLTQERRFQTQDMMLESSNRYASVIAVPLDEQPLASSERVLIQIGTIARPTGWAARQVTEDDGPAREVVQFGGPPWQITRFEGRLTLRNSGLTEAIILGPNGLPRRRMELERSEDGIALNLPPDTLYVILQ